MIRIVTNWTLTLCFFIIASNYFWRVLIVDGFQFRVWTTWSKLCCHGAGLSGKIKGTQRFHTRGGHRHLQIGWMLDIDLIPNLRSKGVKGRTFLKNRNQRSFLLPRSLHRSKIELVYLRPSIFFFLGGGEGGERIKPHLEVIICIFEPWTETLRRSNIIQKQAPTARQTQDASQPPPPTPPPRYMCGNLCSQKGQEAIPS
jgi:hypothetical protein